jgi:hypothetical protein
MNASRSAGTLVRVGIPLLAIVLLSACLSPSAHAQGGTRKSATKSIKATASGTTRYAGFSYFPTASTTDGRMISLVGANFQSMSGGSVEFGIGLPASADSLRIGIFDGETGGRWDFGSTELEYRLYADSTANGDGIPLLYTWYGHNMVDNGWYNLVLPLSNAARSSDTIYFYRLVVTLSNTSTRTWSNFKIRTNGSAMMLPRAFSFAVPLFTTGDAQILYPNYPSTTSTTYDGTWAFNISVPDAIEDFEIWDGDMDYGSYDAAQKDTNDSDTPDSIPSWARNTAAVGEGTASTSDYAIINGVRSTTIKMTGAPADDNQNTWYRRSPSVTYTLEDPNGIVYTNGNPSGNLEWERFRISTIMTAASDYDYFTNVLPAGTYKVRMTGMDLGNLNAWRFWYSNIGAMDTVTAAGDATTSRKDTEGPSTSSYRGHPVMVGVDSAGNAIAALVPSSPSIGGVGTTNYWQNNNTYWPIEVITVGGITYTRSQAKSILNGLTNDRSKQVARQLIAAKLNILSGNSSSCIYQTIADAEAWLRVYPINCAAPNWTTGRPIHDELERYNKGQLSCAAAMH